VGLFYKELKLATFDAGLSAALGFSPVLIHYAFMTVLSITTVGAFTAVGAILVVALLIVPAAAAYLLTDRLPRMIGLAVAIGAFSAVAGYGAAIALDVSVAGAMATAAGLCFGAAFFFSPRQGLAVKAWQLRRRRVRFAANTLVVHLLNHERAADEAVESQVAHLGSELRWSEEFAGRVLAHAARADLVRRMDGRLELSERGRAAARQLTDQRN
jgi:manganese/zinc/iron transport system permease protein